MRDDSTVAAIPRIVLDTFAERGPDLDGVAPPGRGVHCIRFDIRGHPLDLLTDDDAPSVFVLELPASLAIDEAACPGALAKTLELIDLLNGTIDFIAGTTAAGAAVAETTDAGTKGGGTNGADTTAADSTAAAGTSDAVG
jgi:hypothetical protein